MPSEPHSAPAAPETRVHAYADGVHHSPVLPAPRSQTDRYPYLPNVRGKGPRRLHRRASQPHLGELPLGSPLPSWLVPLTFLMHLNERNFICHLTLHTLEEILLPETYFPKML